jgi:hypothetical protein
MKRKPYHKPTTPSGRIAEARGAIERLRASMQGDNRFGTVGQNCRDAIARWQAVIDRETSK